MTGRYGTRAGGAARGTERFGALLLIGAAAGFGLATPARAQVAGLLDIGANGAVALGGGSIALRPGLAGTAEAFSNTPVASVQGALSVGAVGAERQIVNVAGGTQDTDAVNLRQLRSAESALVAGLGAGASLDVAGRLTLPRYAIRGALYDDVGGALAAVDTDLAGIHVQLGAAATGATATGATATSAASGRTPAAGFVRQDATTRTITVGAATDGAAISVASATGNRVLTGVAGGSSPNDAATVGQMGALDLRLSSRLDDVPLRADNAAGRPAPAASGTDSVAVGFGAAATGRGAGALGSGATAGGDGAVAIGQNAAARGTNSVAIGQGAVATRTGQVALGTGASTYTLAGLPSRASAAAQSGPTTFVTTDANGNLATSAIGPASLDGRLGNLEASVGTLGRYAQESRREARQGIAAALAMTSASMPSAPGRTTWVANGATFRGEWASGGSLAYRLDTVVPLAVTAGYAYGGGSTHAVRAGLGGEF